MVLYFFLKQMDLKKRYIINRRKENEVLREDGLIGCN